MNCLLSRGLQVRLLPDAPEWEKYETAFREQTAQAARLHRGWNSMTSGERREFTGAMSEWAARQEELGRLPRTDALDVYDKRFLKDVREFLFLEATADLNAGLLTRGFEHLRCRGKEPDAPAVSSEERNQAEPAKTRKQRRNNRDPEREL